MSPKSPLFLTCKKWMFKNSQRAPFHIFRYYATHRRQKNREKISKKFDFFKFYPHEGTVEENTRHFEVLLIFLSLRYGADLGRSQLVRYCEILFSFKLTGQLFFRNNFSYFGIGLNVFRYVFFNLFPYP